MREIKFRSWNGKDMEYSDEYNSDLSYFFARDMDSNIIMQYTGLKDKNGTEIYEGDIVKFHWNAGLYGHQAWKDTIGEITNRKDFNACGGYGDWVIKGASISFIPKYGIVLGNIYENPELLNGN